MAKSKDDKKPLGIESPAESTDKEASRGRQTSAPKCDECGATCSSTRTKQSTTYYKCPTCGETTKQVRPRVRPEDKPAPFCPYCSKQTEFSKKLSNSFQMVFVCECKTGYSESRYRSGTETRVKDAREEEGFAAR